MSDNMHELEHPVLNVMTSFDTVPGEREDEPLPFEQLYEEVTEGMNGPPAEYSESYHIFGTLHQMNNYLDEQNLTSYTSVTMEGWTATVDQIADDYYQIHNLSYFDSELFNSNVVGPVLKTCRTLFLVSVIVPTLFLTTIPSSPNIPTIPAIATTLAQVFILILTGIYGYRLFNNLINLVGQSEF